MTYAVEVYRRADGGAAEAMDRELERGAAELRREGVAVEYVGQLAIPGDEMVFYLFDSASRDSVEALLARLGLAPDRIVDALAIRFRSTGEP